MQPNRKIKNHNARKRYPRGLDFLAVAIIAAMASPIADATTTIVPIDMPVVQANAGVASSAPVKTLDWMTDELRALIHAEAVAGGGIAAAKGAIGLVDVLEAHSKDTSAAWVDSWMEFTVVDPQNRPVVKTILDFTAVAEAGTASPGIIGLTSSAGVVVTIGPSDGSGVQLRVDNDTLSSEIIHTPQFLSYAFQLWAYGARGLATNVDLQPIVPISHCAGGISMNGQIVSEHPSSEGCAADTEKGRLELTAAPGTYVMHVLVFANFNGLAVSDPVWQTHPDNPDVIVTRHSPTGVPSAPLAGTSADDLLAQGIDPTPFIEAGLFDPPSSEPPPPPPATPKYWCSPGFWLNNAVTFGASAWPGSERTYFDYNSTAGQRAGCPTASGNATLLQILQHPSGYFGKTQQGTGFNCVGDYLSAKSGLLGTKADNNGVCSIDQFGHQTQ